MVSDEIFIRKNICLLSYLSNEKLKKQIDFMAWFLFAFSIVFWIMFSKQNSKTFILFNLVYSIGMSFIAYSILILSKKPAKMSALALKELSINVLPFSPGLGEYQEIIEIIKPKKFLSIFPYILNFLSFSIYFLYNFLKYFQIF